MSYPSLPKRLAGGQHIPQWFDVFDGSFFATPLIAFVGNPSSISGCSAAEGAMISSTKAAGAMFRTMEIVPDPANRDHGPDVRPARIGPRLAMIMTDPGGKHF